MPDSYEDTIIPSSQPVDAAAPDADTLLSHFDDDLNEDMLFELASVKPEPKCVARKY